LFNRFIIVLTIVAGFSNVQIVGQCLSSVNPVGGTENLLTLERRSLRVISFYKYSQGTEYYEKSKHAEYHMVDKAFYNNLTYFMGYGLNTRLAIEGEFGYFINKTQVYNTDPEYRLRGHGFSNIVLSARYDVYTENFKRVFVTIAPGIKIPATRNPQKIDNVQLPIEVQPGMGSYGLVLNSTYVKENSGKGIRLFITNRFEANFTNKNDYRPGNALYTSLYFSKHIMSSIVKGDWTAILQFRNEVRMHDVIAGTKKESSGGVICFVVPQINHVIREKWNVSVMFDLPVYQYFNGIQLGAGYGITLSLSRTLSLQSA